MHSASLPIIVVKKRRAESLIFIVVYQNITRIDKSIKGGDFFTNDTYCQAVDKAIKAGKAVHIIGLLSPGGIHSHQNQIFSQRFE